MSTEPALPQEIADLILQHLDPSADDAEAVNDLRQCSLVCKAFVPASRATLFREVSVTMDGPGVGALDLFIVNLPWIAQYVECINAIYAGDLSDDWRAIGPPSGPIASLTREQLQSLDRLTTVTVRNLVRRNVSHMDRMTILCQLIAAPSAGHLSFHDCTFDYSLQLVDMIPPVLLSLTLNGVRGGDDDHLHRHSEVPDEKQKQTTRFAAHKTRHTFLHRLIEHPHPWIKVEGVRSLTLPYISDTDYMNHILSAAGAELEELTVGREQRHRATSFSLNTNTSLRKLDFAYSDRWGPIDQLAETLSSITSQVFTHLTIQVNYIPGHSRDWAAWMRIFDWFAQPQFTSSLQCFEIVLKLRQLVGDEPSPLRDYFMERIPDGLKGLVKFE